MEILYLVAIVLIAAPMSDMLRRWSYGSAYRELKKDNGGSRVVERNLHLCAKFFEPRWYHYFFPICGILLLLHGWLRL
jgi:hypothetical protein